MNRPKIRPILGSILLFSIIAILIPNHLFGPQITIFGPIEFIRLKGEPATKTVTFNSPIYVKQGTLTIFNGETGDKHFVTSGNYQYDANCNLTKITTPDGKQTQMTYDAQNFLKETINNDGSKSTVTRNTRGEIISITDEENRTVTLQRDTMGRILKETSPTGRTVSYEWGSDGCASCGDATKLTKIIDSGNKQWEFEYDTMGNPITMIYPDGSQLRQTFDISGRLTSHTNKRGQTTRFTYDPSGRLTKKTTPEGTTAFQYDDKDRLLSLQAPSHHYTYRYGVTSDWKTLVEERNQTTNLWTQNLTNQWGLPADWIDSFQWHKMYVYNFTSSTGTPVGPSPQEVLYYKQDYGTPYRVQYTYNKPCSSNTKSTPSSNPTNPSATNTTPATWRESAIAPQTTTVPTPESTNTSPATNPASSKTSPWTTSSPSNTTTTWK